MNPSMMVGDVRMPHDDAAESRLLSAMMMSPDVFAESVSEVSEADFFVYGNRLVYAAMRRLFDSSVTIDPVTLADSLRSSGDLETAGGLDRLLSLGNDILSIGGWRDSAAIVRRDRVLRDMICAAAEIAALASGNPRDTGEVIERAEGLLLSVTDSGVRSSHSTLGEMMEGLYDDLATMSETGDDGGIRTGFPGLDGSLLGLRPGQMVVIGARPGVGKTSLCLNMATNMARNGVRVAMFSLEMSRSEIAQRMLSTRSGLSLSRVRSGRIMPGDWPTVIDSIEDLSTLPIVVDDASGTNVTEIRAKARRMLHGCEHGVVIIDYMQLMSGGNPRDNRATQVGEMSRGIKVMAKDLGVPVIALSQLNREVEGRTAKIPQLSDLRESGAIEQDADIVILLDRSMTPEEAARRDRPDEGVTNLIVAKNRSGPLGTISMRFDGGTTRFLELAKGYLEERDEHQSIHGRAETVA